MNTLERAITKALENGWEPEPFDGAQTDLDTVLDWYEDSWQRIIYNHDFARALFGEDEVCGEHGSSFEDRGHRITCEATAMELPAWKFHLREMVIAPDPIKYLEDNI